MKDFLGKCQFLAWQLSSVGRFLLSTAPQQVSLLFLYFFSSRIVLRFMVCFMTPPRRIVGAVIRESRLLRSDTPERYHGRVLYHRPF
jgi:hypothetical protein